MTINELIENLLKVENKNKEVLYHDYYYGETSITIITDDGMDIILR